MLNIYFKNDRVKKEKYMLLDWVIPCRRKTFTQGAYVLVLDNWEAMFICQYFVGHITLF